MNGRVFSVILLPTAECNVACTYCFEHKEPHRLSLMLFCRCSPRRLSITSSTKVSRNAKSTGRAARR